MNLGEIMKILVTGGAGYIGSHTCVQLLENGIEVVVIDNLINSCKEVLYRIEKLTGKKIVFYEYDVCNEDLVRSVFKENAIDAVIHFAGLKAVGESVEQPLMYYSNNIFSTICLLKIMAEFNVKKFIFSSSATVYGAPESVPIDETFPLSTTSPYGTTKLMIESILKDMYKADNSWNIVILRYFNPIGAHKSGLIGEDPNGIPNNLVPFITQVAVGKLKLLNVFGDDYDTKDGTGVRDYIHVVDLANGHIAALNKVNKSSGFMIYNLGTGNGYSVLDIIKAFEDASGREIPYEIKPRRSGDIAKCYANPSLAERELNWKAEYGVVDMCRDSWNWQKNNPNGYK